MDVPRRFLVKSDSLRKILMNKSFSDAEKLKLLHSGLSTGDFTEHKNSRGEQQQQEQEAHQQRQQQQHQQQQQKQQDEHQREQEHEHNEYDLGLDDDPPQLVDRPEPDELEIDDDLIARVLSSLPKSQHRRGGRVHKLMARYPDKLWFNKDLELVKKGVTIELTNICDLLRDLLQRREQASPLAWRLFIEGLYSIKIPQNLIGNVDRINHLSGLNPDINPDTQIP
jgi:hypothetical protein